MNTIYLSNWSSHRTTHGPGRKLTIMARPRQWEVGEGRVLVLAPAGHTIAMMLRAIAERGTVEGESSMLRYRRALEDRWHINAHLLAPGRLTWVAPGGLLSEVADGDTLCCACSVAEARAGRCHRAWAGPFLVRAGWRVVLDGEVVA